MSKEIAKVYNPKDVEDKWYDFWLEKNYFHAEVDPDKKPYTIVIPPPNVTSVLHMGHAYNNTVQDILIRYHRKKGYAALWLPGTDHAGIATQSVVERELAKEGKSRYDLGREKFVEKVWEWKKHHGSIIINQLKKMGCSCDWQRERFTLDEGLSRAVGEVFVRLYNKGLIYRGLRIVNWDPASATALADDEVDHKEVQGKLYHIRYKLKDSNEYIVVATTRPETLLGDTAVAVAPDDDAKRPLINKKVIIPFVNREVEIIVDSHVDKEFGSGFVKVTPAHDPNDFEIGERHDLDKVIVLDKDGKVLPVCRVFRDGDFEDELHIPESIAGKDRFEARKIIVQELERMGQLEKVENHIHAVGHSYRSRVPVEPYLSEQWFVKMKPLAKEALRVVKEGKIKFYPEGRFERTYEHWMETIRDWCISRQLWWGHRIPVWYNERGEYKVSLEDPSTADEKWEQDSDVLDTWFSSQLWPFSTLGWPDETEDLKYFYPTDTLVTAPDIIFFWVARMIMAGLEFMGEIPFHNVYFNGIVRDQQGRKMSKSLGNGIDPLEMIEEYSADAVRFTIVALSSEGQDIKIGPKSFEMGRNFSNKIWNAFRFLQMNLDKTETDYSRYKEKFTLEDRWILSRLNKTITAVSENIDKFRVNDALDAAYHFFWHDYCDWYLEMIKPRLYNAKDESEKKTALALASHVMKTSMELLHPFIPFITEEIWQHFRAADEESVVISAWPQPDESALDEEAEESVHILQEAIGSIRNIRAEMNVPPGKRVSLFVEADTAHKEFLKSQLVHFASLARVESIRDVPPDFDKTDAAVAVVKNIELFIPMADLIDRDKERQRLEKELQRLQGLEKALQNKLNNPNFLQKAPAQVVETERKKLQNIQENLQKVRQNYEKFK
ncbi:MAG TPA: valine--tRNA ligase [Caldithrix abyssi]|uniref:Valine--tRNA ligase n=1 Tax=Caldithrix abyssi TaxID=187145 RepID=A0A7V4TZE8_CALAY|nr:valine--tRNA ligase [Caldithrix abyssi]